MFVARRILCGGVSKAAVVASKAQIVKSGTQVRFLSGLDFKPIPDEYLNDPLDETARSALAKSCYVNINWRISENATVFEAIQRMAVHKIGALAVCDGDGDNGEIIGVISERDYLCKIGVLGKTSKGTKVHEVCTRGRANLVSVTLDNPIDACMRKLLNSNVRHLLVREKVSGKFVGMISIKDIVKCAVAKHDAIVNKLTGMVVLSEAIKKDI